MPRFEQKPALEVRAELNYSSATATAASTAASTIRSTIRSATGRSAAFSSAATSVWAAAPVELEAGEGAGAEPVDEEEDDDGSGVMGRLGMPANRRSATITMRTRKNVRRRLVIGSAQLG